MAATRRDGYVELLAVPLGDREWAGGRHRERRETYADRIVNTGQLAKIHRYSWVGKRIPLDQCGDNRRGHMDGVQPCG